ncbi:DUF1996 domain-containing protein [Streptomyces ipomoeae]|jgi:hypothetical protein|uniref:DUF1996 domain-containing protein n=2 Tax=Streptomyces ipomoeae TaxID=103232 RepID=L1KPB3_9ACTN|nr:DUF1996 domain-containing protein [Streptomyces ipomoeae]EKX62447.1 hypothetical protein STRIP9103_02446 [Streptomyces ipomoeae 91-03]MDX2699344.1 DUF1996 domain-containing protein [Streptomyces ipomoeae]MDX2826186.1 DUF1996 domain-containing protein [Streptomyces ipomoeae]MDX2846527.1 DUF1996 domain-containing protein [Streptomyces ipomoeae]MDX2879110.1 DUF1996 domain-containing protein [Streptomyces ipomoeae]
MGRNTRKRRSPLAVRAVAASAALAVAGGGLVWANFYASAGENKSEQNSTLASAQVATIDCPDVGQQLTSVPTKARAGVAKELALLDQQITQAYKRLADTRQAQAGDPGFVNNAILSPLKSKRVATLDRIGTNIRNAGGQAPQGLEQLATCQGKADQNQPNAGGGQGGGRNQGGGGRNQGRNQGQGQNQGQNQGGDGQNQGNNGQGQGNNGQGQNQGQGGNGPAAADFVDITTVQPNGGPKGVNGNGLAANGDSGSTGTFTTSCGTNENENRNSDNVIVAPGVSNGAQHQHDYVGNQSNNAFASDQDLANAQTTCQNQGDKSSYFWPVIRLQDGTNDIDANAPGGGQDGNVGRIVEPSQAELKFVGNKKGDVVAMPQALRIITGDAKSFVNGLGNANTNWSCTGFEDRVVTDKYPICPQGSSVVRTSFFQSCWDGQNIDSANHRTHVDFVEADGSCSNGFQAIPQLQVRLVYDIPAPSIQNGQLQNAYAIDSFPDQLHKAITDHNDFINFFDQNTMNQMVQCINSGQDCQ